MKKGQRKLVSEEGDSDLINQHHQSEESWMRDDLSDIFGFVLKMPAGVEDSHGRWWYGLPGPPTLASKSIVDQYRSEMTAIVSDESRALENKSIATFEESVDLRVYQYQIGPAAESWPAFFFEIIREPERLISVKANLYTLGQITKAIIHKIQKWSDEKTKETPSMESLELTGNQLENLKRHGGPRRIEAGLVLTRIAVVSLCFQYSIDAYGLSSNSTVEISPRGWVYGGSDHPEGRERYLVRIRNGERRFVYCVDGTGLVTYHFLETGNDITQLPLPDFGHPDHDEYWKIYPSSTFAIT